jgi:hypothetical protein
MWESVLVLFVVYHFTSDPTRMWHGLCLSNCPTHKGGVYLFPATHIKHKQKKQLKLKNPKNSIEKTKRRGRKNKQEKTKINKIFKITIKN